MRIKLIAVYTILIIVSILHVFPSLWVLLSTFKEGQGLFSLTLFPHVYTLKHYWELFAETDFLIWTINTLKISIISTVIGTFLAVITSYVISRYRFAGRKSYMNGALVITMFPGVIGLVAIYIILLNWGLLDNHLALIIVYSTGPVIGWVLIAKGFYDTFSKSLDESARMDGAGHWTIFYRIFVPLSKPLIVFVSLMTFSGTLVDYIFPSFVITSPEKYTLAMGLFHMVNDKLAGGAKYTLFATGSVILAVPIALLFLSMQSFLVQGLTSGANKE